MRFANQAQGGRSEGVILVQKDPDGKVQVARTRRSSWPQGPGLGRGGVGLVVGLFSPPMLASIVVGRAADGLIGTYVKHRMDSGLKSGLGDKLQPDTAAVIAVVDDEDDLAAERALAGSPAKSVVPMEKKGLRELKAALAEAAGKVQPGAVPVLPIPGPQFSVGRRAGHCESLWPTSTFIPGPKAPQGTPNVLVVLIDDAGFGSIDSFGGPVATRISHQVQEMGITYKPLPRDRGVFTDTGVVADRPQPASGGLRLDRRVPGPFPGYSAAKPRSCAALPRILKENGYVTGGFGKWHLTPDNVRGRRAHSTTGPRRGASTIGGGSWAGGPARPDHHPR